MGRTQQVTVVDLTVQNEVKSLADLSEFSEIVLSSRHVSTVNFTSENATSFTGISMF